MEKDEAFIPKRPYLKALPTIGISSEYSFIRLFIKAVIVVESSLYIVLSSSILVVKRYISL